MTAKECPIGLICEHFECDRSYCFELAKPWPLPCDETFYIAPKWKDFYVFVVEIPDYREHDSNDECRINQIDDYNHWVGHIRLELWLYGWWNALELPYQSHPDGGLLVVKYLELDSDVTFASPWEFDGYQRYRTCWEYFVPPVPVDAYQRIYDKTPVFLEDDFVDAYECHNYITLKNGFQLIFAHHFDSKGNPYY
ncbi:MAG: hypothetical protein RMX63_34525 [Aulosira sp. ZfuCHP01]|nr:hypothetical protein [Aulosira sp. ZfuVER01]MDZ8002350.1 hypothetical protein [Aulosira sp. DedVER01a]MDZ8056542.1 hypothetical protein [Aulosira sp. ZfuCHP01]